MVTVCIIIILASFTFVAATMGIGYAIKMFALAVLGSAIGVVAVVAMDKGEKIARAKLHNRLPTT